MSDTTSGATAGEATVGEVRVEDELRVWAPAVAELLVEEGGTTRAMRRADGGWWVADPPSGDYLLVADGFRMPDPASTAQPAGFDGPSRRDDPATFAWSDATWTGRPLDELVIYELHVGTFSASGTFDGVLEHLDHLVELGIGAIELMPVNTFPGTRGWGYDGVQWFAPHHAYGGPDGLRRLVDGCHRRGLAVVVDVVYNHLGPLGNHLSRLGPWFTDRHRTPWGDAIDLDGPDSAGVRGTIVANAVHWIRDFHVDGLRLDAVHALHDDSPRHVVAEVVEAVHAAGLEAGRSTFVIVESDLNDPVVVTPSAEGGWGADASWSDDFHHALHVALTGERNGYYGDYTGLGDLRTALERVFVYDGQVAPSRGRAHGRPVGDLPRRRFVGYSQTHDQVGNRALGERLVHLAGIEAAYAAAATVVLSPFVPMLFQGEEWGATAPFLYMTDHPDEELAEAVRRGRREEFAGLHLDLDPPDPQAPETLRRSSLDWDEPERDPHRDLLAWYRQLVELRRRHLHPSPDGEREVRVVVDEDERWWRLDHGELAVLVALAGEGDEVRVPARADDAQELASRPDVRRVGDRWILPRGATVVVSRVMPQGGG